MASIKVMLWKHDQKKNGTFPIAIRITKDRKTRYLFTGEYIFEEEWDFKKNEVKKSHDNSVRLNNLIQKKLTEAHATILDAKISDENLNANQIKKKVKRQSGKVSFFKLASERIGEKYLAGTFSVAKSELSILYNIEEFLTLKKTGSRQEIIDGIKARRKERISDARKNGPRISEKLKRFEKLDTLSFEDIDLAFINKFKSFCTSYLEQKTRTVTNQLIFIRTLYNLAIKERISNGKNYPFADDKEKIRIKSGNKVGLNREEIEKIEHLELEEHTSIWHTKNVWLFAYYFAGVRISDVIEMKWSDFIDGRLYYQMNKNEKPVSLKVPQKAEAILNAYKPDKASNKDYVFPFLKKANPKSKEDVFTKTRNATKLLNKYLKRIADMCDIEKNLSNHIARHTFGNMAGDKIHPLKLQKLYRHSNLKTTLGYQANFIHKDVDDALDQVLNS